MKTSTNKKYILELSEEQASIIQEALNLYSRIGHGQLEEIYYLIHFNNFAKSDLHEKHGVIMQLCGALKSLMFNLSQNSSFGVGNKNVPKQFTEAWDIYQVIRNRLAWDKHPEGGNQVIFDTPLQYGEESLPKITKK